VLKKTKILSKILEWVAFAILLGILILVASPYLPFKNVPKSFVVVSGSMEPTIHTGSVAFVKPVLPSGVKKGDIIAFTSPSNPKDTIIHRVDSVSSTNPLLFKTKGDNNNAVDNWDVMGVSVKGIYFGAIPYLGYIGAFVRQPLGFGFVIVLPALIFIISQIINIKKTISKEIEKGVAKKLEEKSVINKIIVFFLLAQAAIIFGFRQTIMALYSDQVTINGITITAGSVNGATDTQQSSSAFETTPAPGATVEPTATPEVTPTDSPVSSPTEEPVPTETPTPTPEETVTPTATPNP